MGAILVRRSEKSKGPATAPRSKWRTISPSISPKCDKTSYWKCIHDTFNVLCGGPLPPPCVTLRVPLTLERRKKKSWSLPLLLLNNLLCGAGKQLGFCRWKHWRVQRCIVSLGGVVVSLLAALRLTHTHSDWRRTPLPVVPFFLTPVLRF